MNPCYSLASGSLTQKTFASSSCPAWHASVPSHSNSSLFLFYSSASSSSLNLKQQLPGFLFFFLPSCTSLDLQGSLVGFQPTLLYPYVFFCCPHSTVAHFWIRPVVPKSQCSQNWWHLRPLLPWAPVSLCTLPFV